MQSGQLNVRMSESLRIEGNLALEAAGWTPSQAVRVIWQFAAAHKDKPAEVDSALRRMVEPQSTGKAEKRALIEEGSTIVMRGMKDLGIVPSEKIANATYEELRDLMYEDVVREMLQ